LQHIWIQQAAEKQKQDVSKDAGMAALTNLGKFTANSKLKQATFAFIASQLLSK